MPGVPVTMSTRIFNTNAMTRGIPPDDLDVSNILFRAPSQEP